MRPLWLRHHGLHKLHECLCCLRHCQPLLTQCGNLCLQLGILRRWNLLLDLSDRLYNLHQHSLLHLRFRIRPEWLKLRLSAWQGFKWLYLCRLFSWMLSLYQSDDMFHLRQQRLFRTIWLFLCLPEWYRSFWLHLRIVCHCPDIGMPLLFVKHSLSQLSVPDNPLRRTVCLSARTVLQWLDMCYLQFAHDWMPIVYKFNSLYGVRYSQRLRAVFRVLHLQLRILFQRLFVSELHQHHRVCGLFWSINLHQLQLRFWLCLERVVVRLRSRQVSQRGNLRQLCCWLHRLFQSVILCHLQYSQPLSPFGWLVCL